MSKRGIRRCAALGMALVAVVGMVGCSATDGGGGDEGNSGEDVTLTVALVPDPAGAVDFYKAQFQEFEADNPHITVNVVENPADQQINAIQLGFQSGNGPDIVRLVNGPTALDQLNAAGFLANLDEYMTDEYKARFPEGSLAPETSGLARNGETLSLPLAWGPWSANAVFLVNEDALAAAGVDDIPTTWDELDEAARVVTSSGAGAVYGFSPGTGQGFGVSVLSATGVPSSVNTNGIDLVTGEAGIAGSLYPEVVDLYRSWQADGVLFPGWESWDGNRAFQEFATGKLGMYLAPSWHAGEIAKLDPDFEYSIAEIPVPDDGRVAYLGSNSYFSPIWGMSSQTEHPDEAWKVLDFLTSEEFNAAYFDEFGTLTAVESAWEGRLNDWQQAVYEVAINQVRIVPNPALSSEGGAAIVEAVSAKPELRPVTSAVDAIINGTDFEQKARELDAAINAIISGTAGSSKADVTFPGWDPLEDFTG